MKSYNNLYSDICDWKNLVLAWKKARKGKTKKSYVMEFGADLRNNLLKLHEELKKQTYKPKPLVNFIITDPKTRKISKSAFSDRIVHHALFQIIEPIFDKGFIYDSCANRKGKGNLFALKRLACFARKVSRNGKINGWFNENQIKGYELKADIKHYFEEVNHEILIEIIKMKITDEKVIWLIEQVISNTASRFGGRTRMGVPLGNLTSQFFANIYLNELDYFVKHELKAKYYLRYVDDFVILQSSKEQIKIWKAKIDNFLIEKLKLELHSQKSRIISLSRGIDFVGFRCFWHYRLLRKRNTRKIIMKIKKYKDGEFSKEKILECFQGWSAYSSWADTLHLRRSVVRKIYAPSTHQCTT
ncbi:MAG: reverse transcriptase/maturase family protein [Nanoarchaeota archaeon]